MNVSGERLHIGGLMRCCTGSWDMEIVTRDGWQDGDTIHCRYALPDDGSHVMVREGGVWKWYKA